jgi:hypothetical protein
VLHLILNNQKTTFPIMKKLFSKIICVGLLIIASLQIQAKTIPSRFSQYELGAWAYRQHLEISELIYPAITNKKLKALSYDGKSIAAEEGHKFFEQEVVAFLSTDNEDPTKGHDTTFIAPITEPFYSFAIYKTRIDVQTSKNAPKISFDYLQFQKLLNEEMKQYLGIYAVNQVVYLNNIPQSSANILISFNKRLYSEGQKTTTTLYKTDSLISTFTQIEKSNRGIYDYPAFVSTDPNDPAKGHDTLVSVPASVTLDDSSNYQYIYYVLKGDASNLHLEAISAAYMLPIQLFKLSFFHGFMKYKTIMSLTAYEKAFLESMILFQIETRLLPQGGELDTYLEKFNLKAEEEARRY